MQRQLYGPDINGALLDDGTIVRIGPREAYPIASWLNPGQPLAAQGWGLTTPYGKVVDAQAVDPTTDQMVQVAPPAPLLVLLARRAETKGERTQCPPSLR